MSKNLKLKKVNKSFVPEPRKSSSVSDSYMRMNIVKVFYISHTHIWLCNNMPLKKERYLGEFIANDC